MKFTVKQIAGIKQVMMQGRYNNEEICQLRHFQANTEEVLKAHDDLVQSTLAELNGQFDKDADKQKALSEDQKLRDSFDTTEHEVEITDKTKAVLKEALTRGQYGYDQAYMSDVLEKFGCEKQPVLETLKK
jgi:TolA-binding protein